MKQGGRSTQKGLYQPDYEHDACGVGMVVNIHGGKSHELVDNALLLTQFTGNLNNFNVIFLLTQGRPQSMKLTGNAGYTDLLVTWLYKMTVTDTNYKMAAVIGIMVFLVTAVVSLVVYNMIPSVRDEEGFQ